MRACVCVPFKAKSLDPQAVTIGKIWKLEKLVLYLIKFKRQTNERKQQQKRITKNKTEKQSNTHTA